MSISLYLSLTEHQKASLKNPARRLPSNSFSYPSIITPSSSFPTWLKRRLRPPITYDLSRWEKERRVGRCGRRLHIDPTYLGRNDRGPVYRSERRGWHKTGCAGRGRYMEGKMVGGGYRIGPVFTAYVNGGKLRFTGDACCV